MEASNEFSYMSAPTSPRRCIIENMFFYSVPTSPRLFCLSPSHPTTPSIYEDANSTLDEFEFETSHRFNSDIEFETSQDLEILVNQRNQQKQQGSSLPSMAFADELFYDGKVLPLLPPLKLPPRLQHKNKKNENHSSNFSSPRSPSSVLKIKFAQRSIWNDDFDPFMVALENVKEENKDKTKGSFRKYRRTQSFSPLRTTISHRSNNSMQLNPPEKEHIMDPQLLVEQSKDLRNRSFQLNHLINSNITYPKEPLKSVTKSPKVLVEPKGLAIARKVRLVKMGNEEEETKKSKMTKISRPFMKRRKSERESEVSYKREGKRKENKIKRFLFRSVSMRNPTFLKRFMFKSFGSTQRTEEKKVIPEVGQMALIQYRPRLFLCIGYGSRQYVQ